MLEAEQFENCFRCDHYLVVIPHIQRLHKRQSSFKLQVNQALPSLICPPKTPEKEVHHHDLQFESSSISASTSNPRTLQALFPITHTTPPTRNA